VKINMRQAKNSDLGFLQKLRSETMDEYLKQEGLPVDEFSHLKRIQYHFEAANILNIHGKPVGLFKYYEEEKVCHVVQVQILPQYQGKGIGKSLITTLQKQAIKEDVSINLSVLKSNPAKSLYERLGFTVISQSDNEFTMQYN